LQCSENFIPLKIKIALKMSAFNQLLAQLRIKNAH